MGASLVLEYAGELHIFVLRRRNGPITAQPHLTLDKSEVRRENTKGAVTDNLHLRTKTNANAHRWHYCPTRPKHRAASPLAPADRQNCASSWKACRAPWRLGAAPSKMQLFRCFHKIHAPSITRVLKPFLCCFGTFLQDFFHQSANAIDLRLHYPW